MRYYKKAIIYSNDNILKKKLTFPVLISSLLVFQLQIYLTYNAFIINSIMNKYATIIVFNNIISQSLTFSYSEKK